MLTVKNDTYLSSTATNIGVATHCAVVGAGTADQQGGNHVICNLIDAFLQVDDHEVLLTPSANLAVAMNELSRFPAMSEVAKATATLKAAAV
jgi:hypothetical protein